MSNAQHQPQQPNAPKNQMVPANHPVLVANALYLEILEKLNLFRSVVGDLTRQLDEIKAPVQQGKFLEFDSNKQPGGKTV